MKLIICCCFGLSVIRNWNDTMTMRFSQSRGDVRRFKIAKNNFDSRSLLMIFPSLSGNLLGENSHQSYSCQSLRSVAAARCFASRFNNTGDCLPSLIYPCHGLPQSNLEQIGVSELLQGHTGRWSWRWMVIAFMLVYSQCVYNHGLNIHLNLTHKTQVRSSKL